MKSACLTMLALLIISCSSDDADKYRCVPCEDIAADVTVVASATSVMPAIPQWGYMIQNDVTSAVAGTSFNLLVMDYTKDGTDDAEQRYTATELAAIKSGGRLAIAYLSIGEAEDYRYYFKQSWINNGSSGQPDHDAPCWLNRTNPDWQGNYKVQYWSEAWQQVVLAYLDKIIDYGYDGVYLDIIDGFEYWSDPENKEGVVLTEAEARASMINFVKRIAYHARVTRGKTDFIIIPQNGERILESTYSADYLAVINGIGVEDLFYNERTATTDSASRIYYLDQVNTGSRKILVVDYVYAGYADTVVSSFRSSVTGKGYYPYAAATDRELDSLVLFSGQGM